MQLQSSTHERHHLMTSLPRTRLRLTTNATTKSMQLSATCLKSINYLQTPIRCHWGKAGGMTALMHIQRLRRRRTRNCNADFQNNNNAYVGKRKTQQTTTVAIPVHSQQKTFKTTNGVARGDTRRAPSTHHKARTMEPHQHGANIHATLAASPRPSVQAARLQQYPPAFPLPLQNNTIPSDPQSANNDTHSAIRFPIQYGRLNK